MRHLPDLRVGHRSVDPSTRSLPAGLQEKLRQGASCLRLLDTKQRLRAPTQPMICWRYKAFGPCYETVAAWTGGWTAQGGMENSEEQEEPL
ncbi:hypothetical protein FGO68_gene17098 [Halteria grandinella]|uniref:Uncharacterized protein n=1 Tax=Halteria grandinella TaxID=5974 RepID=A0A8J8NJE8_HALGN|nr:hypothetical protein FGO68_gene17098 [Halteria grandinella]